MWFSLYLISTAISGAINVSKSMYIKRKMEYNKDEVIKKFNNLSDSQKLTSNLKNVFMTLCPIVNIIHSIKNLKTNNDALYSKWKKNTLDSYVYLDRRLDEEPAAETTEATETVQKTRTPSTTDNRELSSLPARRTSNRTNGSTPLPARRPATENNEYVIEPEIPVRNRNTTQNNTSALKYLRSEYGREKAIYDQMVRNNASKSEIRTQVLKINAIVAKYKEIKNRNSVPNTSGPKLTLK